MTAADFDEMLGDMRSALPEAQVPGYEGLINAMTNAVGDRHVLAAAVVGKADLLVTRNLRDFPAEACSPYNIDVQSTDTFLLHALSLAPYAVHEALSRQAAIKRNPPMSVADVLGHLEDVAPNFVSEARIDWEIVPPGG